MRLLPLILCLLVPTTGYADDDAAIAESPQRVFKISLVEANWVMGTDGEPRLRQYVFWSLDHDRHTKTTSLTDRGWKQMDACVLSGSDGAWAVEYDDVRIEAPLLMQRVTEVDPELEYRTGSNTIW